MSGVTSQADLKANLLEALKLRAGLDGVQVTWGWPKTPAKEMIALTDIRGRQEKAELGPRRRANREESYKLEVIVKVEKQGVDQSIATLRAYALAAELEDQLLTDSTVGGVVREAQVGGRVGDPGRFDLEEFVTSDGAGRMAVLVIDVACQARV
jgi:hypothetical protein